MLDGKRSEHPAAVRLPKRRLESRRCDKAEPGKRALMYIGAIHLQKIDAVLSYDISREIAEG